MYKNVEALVMKMDEAAVNHRRTTKVVSLQGVDPVMLQQALAMFGARPIQATGQTGGSTPGSMQSGTSPFGGNQPGGNQPGGYQPGGTSPGGVTPNTIQPGFQRGPRGGPGSGMSAPPASPGGSGFFADRVKDDPELTTDIFFDPQLATSVQQSEIPVGAHADRVLSSLEPVEYQLELPQPRPMPPAEDPEIRGPRGTISAAALPDLGLIIIQGNTPEDVAEILKIIEEIKRQSAKVGVEIRMVELKEADATAVVFYLNQLYQRVNLQANGNAPVLNAPRTTTTQGVFASVTQTQTPPSSVALLALPRFNAILVACPGSQIDKVVDEIKRLDQKNPPIGQAKAFQLQNTPASRVATLLTNFYSQRFGPESTNQHQTRFLAEDKTNSVLVQAAPADMEDIAALIKHIDENDSKVPFEIRIVRLNNALSDDLTALLQAAIAASIVVPTQTPAAPGVPGAPAALTPIRQTTPGGITGTATKALFLRFVSKFGPAASGLLEDVHLSSDPRTNAIVIFAPEKTMELLLRLIAELDTPPSARAFVKVYTLKKADATTLANMLQQLFLGTGPAATTGTTTGAPRPPVPRQHRPAHPARPREPASRSSSSSPISLPRGRRSSRCASRWTHAPTA